MAHYAFLDKNNIVIEVITGRNENEIINVISDWEKYYGKIRNQKCVRTSYNNNIRKNYAGIGFFYDEKLDAFIPPKPFESWILDENICLWNPPILMPQDSKIYKWNEELVNWELLEEVE